jgi:hypothetical protein
MSQASVIVPVGASGSADNNTDKDDLRNEFEQPFDLVLDDTSPEWNFPAVYYYPSTGDRRKAARAGSKGAAGRIPLGKLIHYGCATFRLYSYRPTEVKVLDALNDNPPASFSVKLGGEANSIELDTRRGYKFDQLVNMGTRSALVREVLQFAGDTEQQITYWPGVSSINTAYSSAFVDENGQSTSRPKLRGKGIFRSSKPVYGVIQAEYQASYRLYRVYYDVPDAGWNVELSDSGEIISYEPDRDSPAMNVIATAGRRASMITIARSARVPNVGWNREDGEQPERVLLELSDSRVSTTKTIVDSNNPENSVDIEQITEVELIDDAGRKFKLRLNDLDGAPPE